MDTSAIIKGAATGAVVAVTVKNTVDNRKMKRYQQATARAVISTSQAVGTTFLVGASALTMGVYNMYAQSKANSYWAEKFSTVNGRINAVVDDVDAIKLDITKINNRLEGFSTKISALENDYDTTSKDISVYGIKLSDMQKNLDDVRVNSGLLRRDMDILNSNLNSHDSVIRTLMANGIPPQGQPQGQQLQQGTPVPGAADNNNQQ